MSMIQTQVADWIATLNLNQWIIEQQLKEITHEEALRPLPFQGNHMNWVLGHLVEHRDWMLRAVGWHDDDDSRRCHALSTWIRRATRSF